MSNRYIRLAAAVICAAALPAVAAASPIEGLDGPGNGQTKINLCHRTHADSNPYVAIEIAEPALEAHIQQHGTLEDFERDDFVIDESHPCPPAVVPEPDPTETPTEPTVTPTTPDNPTVTVPSGPTIEVSDAALNAQGEQFSTVNPVEGQVNVEGELAHTGAETPLLGGLFTGLTGAGVYLRRRFAR